MGNTTGFKKIIRKIQWVVWHYCLNIYLAFKNLVIAGFWLVHAFVPVKQTDPDYLGFEEDWQNGK